MNVSTINISGLPNVIPTPFPEITYNDVLGQMTVQVSDRFYHISWLLLGYVLLQMFVFREGARLRPWFDKLDKPLKIEGMGENSLRDLIYFAVTSAALSGSLMLVLLQIGYRMGVNI